MKKALFILAAIGLVAIGVTLAAACRSRCVERGMDQSETEPKAVAA